MLKKLEAIYKDYVNAQAQMSSPEVLSDPKKIALVGKKISNLEPFIPLYTEYVAKMQAIDFAKQDLEPELKELAEIEADEAKDAIVELEEQLKIYLVPKDPDDDKNVILEIRAGAGGDEAALFAAELLRMYIRFAETHHWSTELLSSSEADSGGIKETSCKLTGPGVYGLLKYESGVHRVQRIPATESKGRIHTSTATVAILPEAEEVDVVINDQGKSHEYFA
jgi:peptide chain release factor 1